MMRKNVLIVILVLGAAIAWRLWREFGRRPLETAPEYGAPANAVFPPPAPQTAAPTVHSTPATPPPPAELALQDYVAPPEPETQDDDAPAAHGAPEPPHAPAHDQPAAETPADSTAPADSAAADAPQQPDDLIRIEGIGPKISTIVVAAGITTFAGLAATDPERLVTILREAGINTAIPTTWPEQARLAAQGDWDGLKALQDTIKNGRVER